MSVSSSQSETTSRVGSFDQHLLTMMKNCRNLEKVKTIVAKQNLYNIKDSENYTLLHYPAQYGNYEVLQYLIDSGSKIDEQNNLGETPLTLAVSYVCNLYCDKVIGILIKAGANIYKPQNSGKNALQLIGQCDEFFSKNLLPLFYEKLNRDYFGNSEKIAKKLFDAGWPLLKVVHIKNAEVTEFVLQFGYASKIDEILKYTNTTPLHLAVKSTDLENVKVLLQYNANVNVIDSNGKTPLSFLYKDYGNDNSDKRLDILKMLLERSSKEFINAQQVHNILKYGNAEAIRLLIHSKIDLLSIADDNIESTVVHLLVKNINPNVIQELRDQEFDINALNGMGDTPLMTAAKLRNVNAIEFLINKGANIEAVGDNGQTALFYAINCNYYDDTEGRDQRRRVCVQALLERGAQVELKTNSLHCSAIFNSLLKDGTHFIDDLVTAHLALQEAKGTTISQFIRRKIDSQQRWKEHFQTSKQQLMIKVQESITLFDLMTATNKTLERYMGNEDLTRKIESVISNISDNYYFFKILESHVAKAKKIVKLKKESASIICKIMQTSYAQYPHIVDKIVGFLEQQDMEILIDALS